ncbi:MAG: antitoxin family protein [Nitrospirae bacterium]|jgi:predicted DNA-binding antitoxin AbrB/MazE fold protein|nr:antitoxin family protein [Nitrospirota bacterium]
MSATIRARIKDGKIELLEQIDLPDGQDIMVTIVTSPSDQDSETFRKSAGRWQGTVDADTLIRNIYTNRLLSNRPAPAL